MTERDRSYMNAAIYLQIFSLFFSSLLPARCIVFFFSFCSFRAGPFLLLLLVCSCFYFILLLSISAFFFVPLRWCRVVMLKTVVYGNQVCFESLKNSAGTGTKLIYVAYIYILDTHRRNDNRRSNKRHSDKDAGRLPYKYILPLTLLQGFERVVQGLHVRGSWRPNITSYFDPTVMTITLCLYCSPDAGANPSGFPRPLSVRCGFPYHTWSLIVWNSTGNCFGSSNSTELNNNSTPTRSPTGSLKSNV